MQTPSPAIQLNSALFSRNGGCGYVLKPKPMRFMKTGLTPTRTEPIKGITPLNFKLSALESDTHAPPPSLR